MSFVLLFTGWVVCVLDLCALQRCVDWSGQRGRFVRHRRTDLSEWGGQNGSAVRSTPYERRAQRSRAQAITHPMKSNSFVIVHTFVAGERLVRRLPAVYFAKSILSSNKIKTLRSLIPRKAFIFNRFKAADGNRTRDLRTTNATLYRLSHSSLSYHLRSRLDYNITGSIQCQYFF